MMKTKNKLLIALNLLTLFLVLMTMSVPTFPLAARQTGFDFDQAYQNVGRYYTWLENQAQELSWRADTAWVDQIVFKYLSYDDDELNSLMNGSIDSIADWYDPAITYDYPLATQQEIAYNYTEEHYLYWSFLATQKFPTNNVHLRRAVAYAYNKTQPMVDRYNYLGYVFNESSLTGLYAVDNSASNAFLTASFGIWSLENAPATEDLPYDYRAPDMVRANHSLLLGGFYDIDNDGWREWWNSTKNGVLWDNAVNTIEFTPDTSDPSPAVANAHGLNADFFLPTFLDALHNLSNWEEVTLYYDTDIGARAFCDSLRPAMNQTGILVKLVSADIFANPDSDNWNVITGGTSPYFVGVDPLLRFTTTDPVWEVDNPWYILIPDYTKYIPSSIYEDYIYQIRHSPDFDTVLQAVYEAQKILAYEVPALPILRFFDTSLYRTDHFKGWVNPINTYLASPWSWLNVRLHSGVPGGVFNQSYISYFDLYSLNPLNYSQMCFSPIFGISRSQLQWWSPLSLIYDTLWVQDPNTALPIPWLADAWDITVVNNASLSEEVDPLNPPEGVVPALKITFTLNPDFKWHDGQPVTPEDVKFSYQLFENTNESYFYGFTKAGGGYIDPARMTTDNEAGNVTFIVESTGYFDFYDTCLPILPKHIWESISDPLSYSNDHPIGSGPYKFKSHDFGFNLILERNLNWPFVPENSTTLDFDGDGLVNGYEKELGTDIWKSDTDGDGDLDGDEIGQWLLDPLNPLLNSNTRMAIVLIPVAVFLGAIGGGLIYLRRDEVKRWLVKKAGREAPDKKDIEDYASQVQELVGAHEELEEE